MDPRKLIERAETDAAFRSRLKANPADACKEAGFDLPADATIEVIESPPNVLNLVLGAESKRPGMAKIVERAKKEPAFQQRLQDSPEAVIEEVLGDKLPKGLKVVVHQAAPNHLRLFLHSPRTSGGELSDLELEAVAGGGFFRNVINAFCGDRTSVTIDERGNYYGMVDSSLGGGQYYWGSVMPK